MANDNPFSGLHLSEQTHPVKIEQRLFASDSPPAPLPQKTPVPVAPEQRKPMAEPKAKPAKPTHAPPTQVPSISVSPVKPSPELKVKLFNLDDEPLYKASYLFTLKELEALEDLKLELRREYDQKVTKNELVRSALHMLLEDHKVNGRRSYATRKIRKG